MAARKPLVVVAGVVQELPTADTLAPSTGDLLAWDSRVKWGSGWGSVYPYQYASPTYITAVGNIAGTGTGGALVYPSGATTRFVDTHIASDVTNTAGTFSGVFDGSAHCDLYRQGGFIFDAAAGLDTNVARCGFIGVSNRNNAGGTSGAGIYSSFNNADLCVGVGRDEGDPANAAYLFVGNGTTRTKTLLTRTDTGYGASSGLTFQVQISCPPGASAMSISVMDLSNDYPCLSNYAVSLTGFPTSATFAALAGSATGGTSGAPTMRLYGLAYSPYPGADTFNQSASNISGNAATATALATARNIQGVSFNGTANIDVISIGTTAPASPVLNQLWIQT